MCLTLISLIVCRLISEQIPSFSHCSAEKRQWKCNFCAPKVPNNNKKETFHFRHSTPKCVFTIVSIQQTENTLCVLFQHTYLGSSFAYYFALYFACININIYLNLLGWKWLLFYHLFFDENFSIDTAVWLIYNTLVKCIAKLQTLVRPLYIQP